MKKITVLLLLVMTFMSCGEDLVFNNPAFRGYNNDMLWEATTYRASVDEFGKLTVIGIRNQERINLTTSSTDEGSYNLGNTLSVAVFENQSETVFTTNFVPDPSIQLYPSEGKVEITEYNAIERTVSGTFSFNAFDSTGLNSANFNRGFFYNIPINTIETQNGLLQAILCANATATVITTLNNLNAVDPDGPQYTQYCNAYKTALQNQIVQCEDDDGSIQDIIDGLGDCSN